MADSNLVIQWADWISGAYRSGDFQLRHALSRNQKWVADFTHGPRRGRLWIWTAEGWLYAAAVIDLFSRRVEPDHNESQRCVSIQSKARSVETASAPT